MRAKDNKIVFILLVLLAVAALTVMNPNLSHQGGGARGQFDGYYSRGIITIRAHQISNWQDYQFVAAHEWGHHVYDTKLTRDDLKAWNTAVRLCGLQSEYSKTYHSRGMKVYEEWGEMYAMLKTNGEIIPCDQKLEVLRRYA